MRIFRGFSFIEVLVSIFLISMMLFLFQAILRSVAVVNSTRNQDLALTIARNKIEEIRGDGYESVPSSGSFSDPLLSSLPSGNATITSGDYNSATKQVTINVTWQEKNMPSPSSISLSTLITEVGGL